MPALSSTLVLLLGALCVTAVGCAAPADDNSDVDTGAATAGGAPSATPANPNARLKESLAAYFTGKGARQADDLLFTGENGIKIQRVAPADLGQKPDFTVRYYQVGQKNDAFGWGKISLDGATLGLVYACEYSSFSKSGSTKVYVFNEAGTAEVLTGTSDRHECFTKLATSVTWDAAPSKAPQLVY